MKVLIQFNPLTTSGSQKWNGAAPIFIRRADLIMQDSVIEKFLVRGSLALIKRTTLNKRREEAITWVIKYFIAASAGYLFRWLFNKGIRDNRLISNPIQAVSHERAEIAMKVPMIIELKNIILNSFIIKKKRVKTFINGVWTQ